LFFFFSKQLAALSALEHLCPGRYPRELLLKNINIDENTIETIITNDGVPLTKGRYTEENTTKGSCFPRKDWYQKVDYKHKTTLETELILWFLFSFTLLFQTQRTKQISNFFTIYSNS
jgi:hypothetical protein